MELLPSKVQRPMSKVNIKSDFGLGTLDFGSFRISVGRI